MKQSLPAVLVLLAVLMQVFSVHAPAAPDNWPQFRGADASGVVADCAVPDKWSDTENVAWKTDIPGRGWSSPVVWGNRVFLTTVVSMGETEEPKKGLYFGGERAEPSESAHQWKVFCLDLESGAVFWERQVHEGVPAWPIHIKNSYASETPVTDGERLYPGYLTSHFSGRLVRQCC
ncbi:MAG: PQQ-binding-like beta-propeller repeat protein [Candidatus Hydrogenedens sp.]|nr:PQQ-binding-like beta-propeller repeat protein [Candidatus Hydrogenedentota bacterium]NLF57633.1 PQQ-binding-like beta-propeller repeat protein [Candidatus Hydrogenedens sp.]